VFLVDDHRMFASSIERVLGDEPDITVVGSAATLDDALHQLEDHDPDVVLVDYALPDSDGPRSITALRMVVPRAKIVVLTGIRDEAAVAAALEARCDGYVTKDRPPAELVAALRSAVAGSTTVTSGLMTGTVVRLRRSSAEQTITPREREILILLSEGVSNARIAAQLHISINTVRNHVQSLLTKLDAHSRLEAVAVAVRRGVLPNPTPGS
jgi:DNA-binding NarL/FixJ family response regulator